LHERLEVGGVLRLIWLDTDDCFPAVLFGNPHYRVRALHRLHTKHRWPLARSQPSHLILLASDSFTRAMVLPNVLPISGRPKAGPLHRLVGQHALEGASRTDH